jgi:hypothetical protein
MTEEKRKEKEEKAKDKCGSIIIPAFALYRSVNKTQRQTWMIQWHLRQLREVSLISQGSWRVVLQAGN